MSISPYLKRKLERKAKKEGSSQSEIVKVALISLFQKEGEK